MTNISSRIANDPRQMPNPFSKASQARLEQARAMAQASKVILDEQYREVRLSAVVGESPLQARAPFAPEQDDDQALLESIASDGQRVPVLLVETAGGEGVPLAYTLLDGHRRIAALRQLNRETVKAVIVRHDSLECDLITLTANVRKHLTPLEQARVIARLRERHGLTLEHIAKKVGLSARYVTELRALLETDPAIQVALEKGAIKAKTALALGQAPREQQPELANIAAHHPVSEADAKRWVARLADTGETPEQAALALGLMAKPKATLAMEATPLPNTESTANVEAAPPLSAASMTPAAVDAPSSRSAKSDAALTIAAAQALLTDAFPELDTQMAQALSESAVKRSASAQVVKVAGLFVLAGYDAEPALDAALPITNTQSVRKVVHILDTFVDLRG